MSTGPSDLHYSAKKISRLASGEMNSLCRVRSIPSCNVKGGSKLSRLSFAEANAVDEQNFFILIELNGSFLAVTVVNASAQ